MIKTFEKNIKEIDSRFQYFELDKCNNINVSMQSTLLDTHLYIYIHICMYSSRLILVEAYYGYCSNTSAYNEIHF